MSEATNTQITGGIKQMKLGNPQRKRVGRISATQFNQIFEHLKEQKQYIGKQNIQVHGIPINGIFTYDHSLAIAVFRCPSILIAHRKAVAAAFNRWMLPNGNTLGGGANLYSDGSICLEDIRTKSELPPIKVEELHDPIGML